jgi:hypothetical protein
MLKVTAKQDATITFDSKLAKNNKENVVLGNVVLDGNTDSSGNPTGTAEVIATSGASASTDDGGVDTFNTLTVEVKAGDVIYFAGKGTNTQLYSVTVTPKNASTTPDVVETSSETTTAVETSSETTTEATVVAENEVAVNVNATLSEDGKTVVAEYVLSENAASKGFNNYTVKLAYDKAVLAPVSVAQGEITIAAKDALGNDVTVNASKALETVVGDTIAYCIFDDGNVQPSSAQAGSLPQFEGNGVLFTVTYNVIGSADSTEIGADFETINTVSSDYTIEGKLVATVTAGNVDLTGSTPVEPDESTSEESSETTTGVVEESSETTSEETPEVSTIVAPYTGEKVILASDILDSMEAANGVRRLAKAVNGDAIEDGFGYVNKMSAWNSKTSASGFRFDDGSVFTEGFQIGAGNEKMSASLAVGDNAFAGHEDEMSETLEKALVINAGAAGTAKVYAAIGSTEVNSAVLYLLDKDGNVVDVQTAAKLVEDGEAKASTGNVVTFNVPEAGEYYIICPEKQTSLNFMAIDLAFGVTPATPDEDSTEESTETTTEATTAATTVAPTTAATTVAPTTEATTEATTTESTETTTVRRSGGGGGGGSSSSVKTTTTTTEATTEATTSDSTEGTAKPVITKDVEVTIGVDSIVVGDTTIEVGVAPYIQSESNSTLVPLRVVSLAILGGELDDADNSDIIAWDSATKTATITAGGKVVTVTAGSDQIVVNGVSKTMDYGVKAEIKNSRMYVPFRALGEALGVEVTWDADTRTAAYKASQAAIAVNDTDAVDEETTEETSEETTAEDSTEETTAEVTTVEAE